MKMLLHILFVFPFIICTGALFGQENTDARIDSAWKAIRDGDFADARQWSAKLLGDKDSPNGAIPAYEILGRVTHLEAKLDSSEFFFQKALALAREEEDRKQVAQILIFLSVVYYDKDDFNTAMAYSDEGISLWKAENNISKIFLALLHRGNLFDKADRHFDALETYLEALELAKALKDSIYLVDTYNSIGIIHKKQGNLVLAKKTYQDGLDIAEAQKDSFGIALISLNLALVYKDEGEVDKAITLLEFLFDYFTRDGYRYGQMAALANLSICNNLIQQYSEAIRFGEKALSHSRELDNSEVEADVTAELAKAYLGLGETDEALQWALRAETIAGNILSIEKKRNVQQTLSDVYEADGNPEAALHYYKAYKRLDDSIFRTQKAQQLLELHTKYETEEKKKEIAQLETANIKQRYQKRGILFGGIVFVIITIIIIYREIQKRKRARRFHETEIALARTQEERLQEKLEFKKRELTSKALHISQKQAMIEELKTLIEHTVHPKIQNENATHILQLIRFDSKIDHQWDQFMQSFTEVNAHFLETLLSKHPELSKTELRIAALIKMNLNNKEIANAMGITDEGIKKARYRLRKKLQLQNSDNLDTYILSTA